MNNTIRRHPRTLVDAFKGPDYACALERPARSPLPRVLWLVIGVGFLVALLAGVGK